MSIISGIEIGATLQANTFTGAQNFARATVASHATTGAIWAAAGNQINWTGTEITTAFPNAPQAGAERVLVCAGACSFTAGANMLIDGVASGNTVTCAANDQVIVKAVSTTQFKLSRVKYDGTAQVSVGLSASSQAQAEAGTANTVAITPLSANWHPGVAKAWLKCGITGSIHASYNITSITDTATGMLTVTIATDFSSAHYVVLGTADKTNASLIVTIDANSLAVGGFGVNAFTSGTTFADPQTYWCIACFGDQ